MERPTDAHTYRELNTLVRLLAGSDEDGPGHGYWTACYIMTAAIADHPEIADRVRNALVERASVQARAWGRLG